MKLFSVAAHLQRDDGLSHYSILLIYGSCIITARLANISNSNFINGRIGVLYSNKDYGCEWDYDFRNKRWLAEDNTKFGVNIINYALTV
jgi:hypothetical protein